MSAPAATAEPRLRSVPIRANVTPRPVRLHSTRKPSAAFRLAQMWGCSEKTAELRLSGDHSVFMMARQAIQVALDLGQTERAGAWMDLVEWPFLGTGVLPYQHTRIDAGRSDAAEDIAEMEYEATPCERTARNLIAKSIHDRRQAERRERSLREQWGVK